MIIRHYVKLNGTCFDKHLGEGLTVVGIYFGDEK